MVIIVRKKILALLILLISVFSLQTISYADVMNRNLLCYTLKTGISMEERVPNTFMGTWRVTSKLLDSGGSSIFKLSGVDLWNLSRSGNVINLSNPFTGASASITVNYVDGSTIRFTRKGNYDNKILTDTVELNLDGERFTGVNTLTLETLSDVNRSVIKTETAKYSLVGEKISGTSIME